MQHSLLEAEPCPLSFHPLSPHFPQTHLPCLASKAFSNARSFFLRVFFSTSHCTFWSSTTLLGEGEQVRKWGEVMVEHEMVQSWCDSQALPMGSGRDTGRTGRVWAPPSGCGQPPLGNHLTGHLGPSLSPQLLRNACVVLV